MGERSTARTATQTTLLLVGTGLARPRGLRSDPRVHGRFWFARPRRSHRGGRVRLASDHVVTKPRLPALAHVLFVGGEGRPRFLVRRAVVGWSPCLVEEARADRLVLSVLDHITLCR